MNENLLDQGTKCRTCGNLFNGAYEVEDGFVVDNGESIELIGVDEFTEPELFSSCCC